ncbi:ankyrin [Xylariaceae sp. FL0255]|nr:ankyrin [Xylariaceae sp. FL0255]
MSDCKEFTGTAEQCWPGCAPFHEHEQILRQLYLIENKSAEKVKNRMEVSYGFPETDRKQYEYGLKHLGFLKKLSIEDWIAVEALAQVRHNLGKPTDVFLSDVQQEWKKINRSISRNPRRGHYRNRIAKSLARNQRPDLPRGVRLKTPPLSPLLASDCPIVLREPAQPPISIITRKIYSPCPDSTGLLRQMLSNLDSTVHLLPRMPSSELITILKQFCSITPSKLPSQQHCPELIPRFPPDGLCETQTIHVKDIDQSRANGTVQTNVPPSTQWELLERLIHICTCLANNLRMSNAVDVTILLGWIASDTNKPVLRRFFSHNTAAVAAVWKGLIGELEGKLREYHNNPTYHEVNPHFEKAFQNLVEPGLEYHDGSWVRRCGRALLHILVSLGSHRTHSISQRLLTSPLLRDALTSDLDVYLFRIAGKLDLDMMSAFDGAGLRFTRGSSHPNDFLSDNFRVDDGATDAGSYCIFPERIITDPCLYISLIVKAGFDVDLACIKLDYVFKNFLHLRYDRERNEGELFINYLDYLWIQRPDLYEVASVYSERVKTHITIPGLITAARGGTEQLEIYLASRHDDEGMNRQLLLEIAMSVAAEADEIESICSLQRVGVDPNAPLLLARTPHRLRRQDWSPLIRAAGRLSLRAFQKLIDLGANPRVGNKAIIAATRWQGDNFMSSKVQAQYEIVRYLCDRFLTPKNWAAAVQNLLDNRVPDQIILDLLLEAGKKYGMSFQVESRGRDMDLLHYAIARHCNSQTVKLLFCKGLQIHSDPDEKGDTMLHCAAASVSQDRRSIIEFLLQEGADITAERGGSTILESVLKRGGRSVSQRKENIELFLSFMKKGARVHAPRKRLKPSSATSVLVLLLQNDADDEVIYSAIQSGADISSPGTVYASAVYTPLQYAVVNRRLNVSHYLVTKGADVNAPADPNGCTALQAACRRHDCPTEFIQFLLDNHADANAPGPDNTEGYTALQCAIAIKSMPKVSLLLAAGANVNAKAREENALQTSIRTGFMSVFCLLLDAGADVNGSGFLYDPNDPELVWLVERIAVSTLDTAAYFGRLDMCVILLEKGAKSFEKWETPYDGAIRLAKGKGHFEIVKILRRHCENRNGLVNALVDTQGSLMIDV